MITSPIRTHCTSRSQLVSAIALASAGAYACASGQAGAPAAQGPSSSSDGSRPAAGVGMARATPGSGTPPGKFLNLTNWKLTLPVGQVGKPTEIKEPEVLSYSAEAFFFLDPTKNGVVFRAPVNGVTTKNSKYPRTELREMNGRDKAAWSTTQGKHTLIATQAITHLPVAKPHVVSAQIHDANDDLVMVRLERENLFVEGGGNELGVLDGNYQLGTPFTVKLEAAGGHVRIYYNDMSKPKVDVERDASGCYFKAGVYTQSNQEKGDDASAYGEVVISKLEVKHE
jgi:poly(beta-D-mannuronate) lyase